MKHVEPRLPISVDKARAHLPNNGQDLTDEQVSLLVRQLNDLAGVALGIYRVLKRGKAE